MPYKDLEQNRKYDRDYRKRPEIIARDRKYDTIWQKQYKHKKRELALKLIGDKCFICNSIKHLCFHEIHGINHNKITHPCFYLKHPEDFITLCYFHHKLIHSISDMNEIELFKTLVLVNKRQRL